VIPDSWVTFQFCKHEIGMRCDLLPEDIMENAAKLQFKAEANIGEGVISFYVFTKTGVDERCISIDVPDFLVTAMADVMTRASKRIKDQADEAH
jgi:hypothetical protein